MAIYKKGYVLNGEVTGELLYSKNTPGWVSGFSSQNTWRVEKIFSPTSEQSFEVSIRVRTGPSLSSPNIQEIFAIGQPLLMRIDANKLALSYNTGTWGVVGSYGCSANTEYITQIRYYPEATTTNGHTYLAKFLYFEIYDSGGVLLHRSSATLINKVLNFVGDYAYLGSQDGGENWGGRIHNGEDTYIKVDDEMWWQPLLEEQVCVSGSVKISKGYYGDGLNKIFMPDSTYGFDALTANQTLGGKNKLFAYTDSTDSVGALITSTTPTGSFKITKDLEQPVYLDPTRNYIAGGELLEPNISFTSGNAEIWVQPVLTSATSYGTCTDSRNNTAESQEGWRALDGQSSTDFSPAREGGWWKWVVPDTLTFKAGTSTIVVTSGSPAAAMDIQFFADTAATKPLTDVVTLPSTVGTNTTIPIINTESTNTIYMTIAAHSSWSEINEISFVNVFKGAVEAAVSSTKALQYSEAQDITYWIPSEATDSLNSVKAIQSVGPVNDLYLTTTAGTPTASLSFSNNGEIVGAVTKLPLKQKVYLNNETDTILGVQERPDEVVITGWPIENYTVVGSPTISGEYVASNFSSSSYCTTVLPSVSNSFTLISRVYLPATLVASGSYGTTFSTDNGDSCYGIINASGTFYTFICGDSELGTKVRMTSGWKWLRMELTSSSTKMYTIDDSNYTEETLPPLSNWTESCVSTRNILSYFSNRTLLIGVNNYQSKSTANWQIDLKNTKYIADGIEWKAVDIQDGVSASGWSHYGPTKTFQFMPGVSFESVAVTPAESYSLSELSPPTTSLLTYPLFYTLEGDLALNRSYQSGYSWYTGYKITFTDTTHTTIDSVEKTGTRCRLYCAKTGPEVGTHGQELTYYAVTIPQFEAGLSSGTQIKKESVINQNLGPIPLSFTNTVTVGNEITYDVEDDSIIEGTYTAIFVGEFFTDL